jgi:ribose-phosphate pyrophosphokinase
VDVMSRIPEKSLKVFSGRSHPELAEEVAKRLDVSLVPQTAHTFANGEIFVRYEESVRGCDAFVIQSHADPINDAIMEQLIMVDALKRASAERVTAVIPFYGYARQDKKHKGREPISARLMADLFSTAGTDRIMTVDLHTAQIQGYFDGPVDHLLAEPLLSEYILRVHGNDNVTVVSPDAGRVRVAEKWADSLGGVPLAVIHKSRDVNKPHQTVANRVVGDVESRLCVLVDDMIDTGGTITTAVELLLEAGAKDIVIAATHGVLSGPAPARLATCGAKEIVVTNTLPIPEERRFPGFTVLSIAGLVARAIHEVFVDGSVTNLFHGNA